MKNAHHMERQEKKSTRQKKGPVNHCMSTISHNYGQTMLYPVIYKQRFDFIVT